MEAEKRDEEELEVKCRRKRTQRECKVEGKKEVVEGRVQI